MLFYTLSLFFITFFLYRKHKKINIIWISIFFQLWSCSEDNIEKIVECHFDNECIDGFSCINEICEKSCRNIYCSKGEICDTIFFECTPKNCKNDDNCDSGFYCNINGECKTKERFCSSSDECFSGYECNLETNSCEIENKKCLNSDECPFGTACSSGECLPTLQCFDIFTNNSLKESAGEITINQNYIMKLSPWYSDWYSFNYDGISNIEFNFSFIHSNGDIDVKLYQNGNLIGESSSAENYESVILKPTTLSKGEIFIEVFLYQKTSSIQECIIYELRGYKLSLECIYDYFEPNNSYQDATNLSDAIGKLLTICNQEKDIYIITPTNKNKKYDFMLSIYYPENSAGVFGKLWTIEGGYPMLISKTHTQSVVDYLEVELDGGKTYYLEVDGRNEYSYTYSLDYSLHPQTEDSCFQDELEPNNAIPTALTPSLEFGNYFLSICGIDVDWHPISLSKNSKVQIIINFNNDKGDLNLALYKFNEVQLEQISKSENSLNYEILSHQASDDETIFIKVYPSISSINNSYFMQILNIE